MSRSVDNKIIDTQKYLLVLARLMRNEVEKTTIKREYIAKQIKKDPSRVSQLLNKRPGNDEDIYRQIAHAIGLSDRQFDDIVAQAKREVFGGGEVSFDHALSSKYGDTPEAMQEENTIP